MWQHSRRNSIGPLKKTKAALSELTESGIVAHDPAAKLFAISNFFKFNSPESHNVVKAWKRAVDRLPECALRSLIVGRAWAAVSKLTQGFQEAFREAFQHDFPDIFREASFMDHDKGSLIQEQVQDPKTEPDASSETSATATSQGEGEKRKRPKINAYRSAKEGGR